MGLTESGWHWFLAEGAVFGWTDLQCDILIANPRSDQDAEVEVIFLGYGGGATAPLVRVPLTLPAGNRATVRANDYMADLFPDDRTISFSTIVWSSNYVDIVAERTMYARTLVNQGAIPHYSGHSNTALLVTGEEMDQLLEALGGIEQ